MDIIQITKAYQDNKIEKKLYWSLLRDTTKYLIQCQKLLHLNPECETIEINEENIVLSWNGIKIAFDFDQTICRSEIMLSIGKNPEQDDFDFIKKLVNKDSVIIDAGANVGVFSMSLLKECPQLKKIYAFEPIPNTYHKMQTNLRLNNMDTEKICCSNIGLSDSNGEFEFYLPGTDEAASLRPLEDMFYLQESIDGQYTGRTKNTKIVCRVESLDDFCEENSIKKIDIIKCDVEGNEKFLLLGAEKILRRDHPVVYTEMLRKHAKRFGYHPNEIIDYMRQFDYTCYILKDKKIVECSVITEDTQETNFFFLKNNGDLYSI